MIEGKKVGVKHVKKQLPKQLEGFKWKKGQSGNLKGRPKGKTLKEFAKEYLMSLPDDEKIEYLAELPKDIVWKMAEGNPQNDITSKGKSITIDPEQKKAADGVIDQFLNGGDKEDTE